MQVSVIKIGGKVIEDPPRLHEFLSHLARRPGPRLLVHGGGRNATQLAQRLGHEATMVEGRRVTDAAMLEVVVMVYGGLVNKQIVSMLQASDCNALGLTGADLDCVRAVRRPAVPVDFGYVGDVVAVQTDPLRRLLEQGVMPVLAPLTHDGRGQLLNTNADTIASRVAGALAQTDQVSLHYLFEKAGVLTDPADERSVVPRLSEATYRQLRQAGSIVQGMVPKLDNAFDALRAGVENVYIAHHRTVASPYSYTGTQIQL